MKVAILGSRGIPVSYGGYETLVERLALGLASSPGIEVTVYCRKNYFKEKPVRYHGVRLVYLPTFRVKALESLIHSFLSSIHVLFQDVNVIFFVDPANAPFFILLRLFGKKVIVNTDGLGWKRRKWWPMARHYYKFVELLSKWTANVLVTDNPAMKEYYKEEYGAHSVCIAYGASNAEGTDESVYRELGVYPDNYLLVVARLEPENNTDFIIDEYVNARIDMPLVVVGDSPYDPDIMKRLRRLAGGKVYFTGYISNQRKLNSLYKGAYIYIHGHEVGGTNPSLLRAMDAQTAPLSIDVSFNKAVIGECGFFFEKRRGSLSDILSRLTKEPEEVKGKSRMAKERADTAFKWESVIEEYKQLFYDVELEGTQDASDSH
ncbi:MAG: DUF1972 domain-containing protein [Candidatus Omnitrophica bacterium]|nr:DUF1972 domain-containing protein [Candidatus Omnitrophota bacterium]